MGHSRTGILIASILSLVVLFSGCRRDRHPTVSGQMPGGNRVTGVFTPTPPPTPQTEEPERGNAPPVPSGPLIRGSGPGSPLSNGAVAPSRIGSIGGNESPGQDTRDLLHKVLFFNPGPETFHFFQNNSVSLSSGSFSQTDEPSVAA